MKVPGHGVMDRDWDLRRGADAYLENIAFASSPEIGQRVGCISMGFTPSGGLRR
jgi:hypothetical protein